jgi:hypothetical protein
VSGQPAHPTSLLHPSPSALSTFNGPPSPPAGPGQTPASGALQLAWTRSRSLMHCSPWLPPRPWVRLQRCLQEDRRASRPVATTGLRHSRTRNKQHAIDKPVSTATATGNHGTCGSLLQRILGKGLLVLPHLVGGRAATHQMNSCPILSTGDPLLTAHCLYMSHPPASPPKPALP